MVGLRFDCLRANARGAEYVGQQQHVDAARAPRRCDRDRVRRVGATRLTREPRHVVAEFDAGGAGWTGQLRL